MSNLKTSTTHIRPIQMGLLDTTQFTGSYEIQTVFEDRLAGHTVTEEIWSGREVNSAHVARLLVDEETRRVVTRFFASRALAKVLPDLLEGKTWQVGGYAATISDVLEAVARHTGRDSDAYSVIMELILPSFDRNQIVVPYAERTPIMRRFSYPFRREPSIPDLVAEVARAEIERSVGALHASWHVEERKRYSVRALANTVADAFFPLAAAIQDAFDYDVIIEDIIKAVRTRIDPECLGLTGDVPHSMANHPTVSFLMHNWTFIEAALSLGNPTSAGSVANGHITSLAPSTSEFRFDKWAGPLLALLKASDRYAILGRQEALQHIGVRVIEDLQGYTRAAVVYEDARMEAVALGVVAIKDATMTGAYNIMRSRGRIDAHIAASYGSVAEEMSTASVARNLVNILNPVVEENPENMGVYMIEVREQGVQRIAALLADRILYNPDDASQVVYRIATDQRLELESGVCVKGEAFTSDPVEVIMAHGDRDSQQTQAMPQLLPKMALNSHLFISNDHDVIVRSDVRYSFDQTIGRAHVRCSMRLAEFEHARHDVDASLVKPMYNDAVFNTCYSAYQAIQGVIAKAPESMQRRLKRTYAQFVIRVARSVSSSLRGSVHALLMRKSMAKTEQHEVQLMRAQFHQGPVMGFTDLVAAAFFFGIQGIGQHDVKRALTEGENPQDVEVSRRNQAIHPLFAQLWADEDMLETMIDMGSDRESSDAVA